MTNKCRRKKRTAILPILQVIIILLLLLITISGICSFDATCSYEFINQYGNHVRMWGAGIYAHDSYFKAPIFIGSDLTILVFVIPLALVNFHKIRKEESIENHICCFGTLSVLLYYSASLAFGVTYNILHLLYIALFGICFYSVGIIFIKLHTVSISGEGKNWKYPFTKGMKIYLFIAGISLFAAWLPDIVASIARGTSLELIEVYTTEVTYVLDMGIISPLMFFTYYLAKKGNFMGYVLLRMIWKVCMCVGIMLPIQTIFQLMAGISIPFPALLTKVFIFVMLAVFAFYFSRQRPNLYLL